MPIDRAIVGYEQTVTVDVERGRLRMFAQAVGETDPVFTDVEAARSAGHPDLPALPTALFGLELETSDTFEVLTRHGADLSSMLHGEQRFTYHRQVHAGQQVTFRTSFTDVYEKAGGALQFVARHTDVLDAGGDVVVELDNLAILREEVAS